MSVLRKKNHRDARFFMFQKVKSFDIDIIVNDKNALFGKAVNVGVSDICFKFLPFVDDKILEVGILLEIFVYFVYVCADFPEHSA